MTAEHALAIIARLDGIGIQLIVITVLLGVIIIGVFRK